MPDSMCPQLSPIFYSTFDEMPPDDDGHSDYYDPSIDTFNICDGCGNSYAHCTCGEEDEE